MKQGKHYLGEGLQHATWSTKKRLQSSSTLDATNTDTSKFGSGSGRFGQRGRSSVDQEAECDASITSSKKDRTNDRGNDPKTVTPKKSLSNKNLISTPLRADDTADNNDTPRIERNSNRSARRKSTRTLIERTILGNTSDNDGEEENIVQHIYGSEDEQDAEGVQFAPEDASSSARMVRAKATKNRKRSPTPPQDLEPHEKYFFHNRGGRVKTSNNDLSSLALLDHEEYFTRCRSIIDWHAEPLLFLEQLHAHSFSQWRFELSQDFNICLYGYGSKRTLLMQFVDHLYQALPQSSATRIVLVNGYVSSLTIRDILGTIASAIAEPGRRLGSQPADMMESLIALLEEDVAQKIILVIHSIDRLPLRRTSSQTIISRLSAHPQVHLIASADHPSFPLLWDSSLRSTYNFVFHDCTTFQPYLAEADAVDEVHELLGRSGRRVGGKEGVSFVLKSLPENAKRLFQILIKEQLEAMQENAAYLVNDDNEDNDDEYHEKRIMNARRNEVGIEYRVLYQKGVEQFVCSNEMNFRTLLKEFHDHQMIQSKKDALGTETLSIPFRKEELETILEDIST